MARTRGVTGQRHPHPVGPGVGRRKRAAVTGGCWHRGNGPGHARNHVVPSRTLHGGSHTRHGTSHSQPERWKGSRSSHVRSSTTSTPWRLSKPLTLNPGPSLRWLRHRLRSAFLVRRVRRADWSRAGCPRDRLFRPGLHASRPRRRECHHQDWDIRPGPVRFADDQLAAQRPLRGGREHCHRTQCHHAAACSHSRKLPESLSTTGMDLLPGSIPLFADRRATDQRLRVLSAKSDSIG